MSVMDMSIAEFSAALSEKIPVPGGGGASALVGALGVALGSMVGNYTLGKKKYADVEPEIKQILAECEDLRIQLLSCVEEDAMAFEPLSKAYGIAKDEPGRAEIMEKCLRDAAAVPMKILRLSCRVIELQQLLAEKGSTMMASDAGTGVVLCRSALYGAAMNVKVNTKLMADREYAGQINAQVDELMDKYREIADRVYESVYGRFC